MSPRNGLDTKTNGLTDWSTDWLTGRQTDRPTVSINGTFTLRFKWNMLYIAAGGKGSYNSVERGCGDYKHIHIQIISLEARPNWVYVIFFCPEPNTNLGLSNRIAAPFFYPATFLFIFTFILFMSLLVTHFCLFFTPFYTYTVMNHGAAN
jgi:hypothetical protein